VPADFPRRRQELVLFRVKSLVSPEQNLRDLASRNVDPQFPQFLKQPSLRDMVLMNLPQDVLPQAHPKMRIDSRRSSGHQQTAVFQTVHRAAITNRVSFDDQILDDEFAVAFESSPLGEMVRLQRNHVVDLQVPGLLPLGRSRSLLGRVLWRRRKWFQKPTRCDLRPHGRPFHPLDLIPQSLNLFRLPLNHRHQGQHQRRLPGHRNLNSRDLQRLR